MSEDLPEKIKWIDPPAPDRNAPCPCGSGKKYKKCHLAADEAGEPCSPEFWMDDEALKLWESEDEENKENEESCTQ